MRHGFLTDQSPIPDSLLLEISTRELQRRAFELSHYAYLSYKLEKLKDIVEDQVKNGMLYMSSEETMKMVYRIKAIKVTQAQKDAITTPQKV